VVRGLNIMSMDKISHPDFVIQIFSSRSCHPDLSSRFLNIMFMDNLVMGGSTVEERASNPLDHVAATHRAEASVADVEVALLAKVLDLLRRRHVPGVNRFSRPTSLLFLFLLDCHRDRWQAPSVARLQGNRSWSSLNGLLLCANDGFCDLGEGHPTLLLDSAHRANTVLKPWQEDDRLEVDAHTFLLAALELGHVAVWTAAVELAVALGAPRPARAMDHLRAWNAGGKLCVKLVQPPQVICKLLISGLHRHLLLPAHDHFSTGSAPKSGRPLEVNVVRGALGGEAAVADGEVTRLAEVLRLLDHWGRTRQPGWRRRWWRRRWRWRWWSLLLLLY